MSEARVRSRAESTAETRRLIIESARRLFARDGFADTTVEDIASAAGVAIATVYTSVGRKSALLAEVILSGAEDPVIAEQVTHVLAQTDGVAIVQGSVAATRRANEANFAAVELLLTLAPTDDVVGAAAARATASYRANVDLIGDRLKELEALKPSMTAEHAADILWFFIGLGAWRRLIVDANWSWDRAEEWLTDTATASLLAPSP